MPGFLHRAARLAMHCYPFRNGQGRIIDRSFLRRLRFDEPTLTVGCRDGIELTIFPNDHIGRHLYLTGQFDRTVADVLLSMSRPGDRFLDIGGHIGFVSCVLLRCVPDCRVVAVEPQPTLFPVLEENLRRTGGDRGRALNVAVSDVSGVGRLIIGSTNSGASRLAGRTETGDERPSIEVALIDGEELFRRSGLDRIDLIKIDVEGHEPAVLTTIAPLLRRFKPRAVVFEHFGSLDPTQTVRRVFDDCGFEIRAIRKTLCGWSLDPVDSGGKANDYVATPRS